MLSIFTTKSNYDLEGLDEDNADFIFSIVCLYNCLGYDKYAFAGWAE